MTTKEQERKALEKIRKIVAELGEYSYVGTALEGCLEDAEQNIENDWACSQKQLADAAAQKVSELEKEIEELKAKGNLMQATIDTLRDEMAKAKAKLLAPDDLTDFKRMTENLIAELRDRVKAAEATILEYAEHPETTTFCDAVRERKNLTTDISYYEKLRKRLTALLG